MQKNDCLGTLEHKDTWQGERGGEKKVCSFVWRISLRAEEKMHVRIVCITGPTHLLDQRKKRRRGGGGERLREKTKGGSNHDWVLR